MERFNPRHKYLTLSMLLIVCFQNFDVSKVLKGQTASVNEDSRMAHAQELIGDQFLRSPAFEAIEIPDLTNAMYMEVRGMLPKKYKNKAWRITSAIVDEAAAHNMDPVFVMAMIRAESHFNPLAKGGVGELGLMQIRPCTAEWFTQYAGIPFKGADSLYDPETNIRIGVAYVEYLRKQFGNNPAHYLPAYNMGAGNVQKLIAKDLKPKVYALRVMKKYKDTYKTLLARDAESKGKRTSRRLIADSDLENLNLEFKLETKFTP